MEDSAGGFATGSEKGFQYPEDEMHDGAGTCLH